MADAAEFSAQPLGGDPDREPRAAGESQVLLAEVMLPSDANPSGNVHGGTLMRLADTAGGVCAARHARSRVVTVVMDSMTFEEPVYVGDLVTVRAEVTWVGRTSVETAVSIEAESAMKGSADRRRISTAFFVYVALGQDGRPAPVAPLLGERTEQLETWSQGERRREYRLRHAPTR